MFELQGHAASFRIRDARGDAGRDATIRERLERDPCDLQARLDEALDESMDGSDPVQLTDINRRWVR